MPCLWKIKRTLEFAALVHLGLLEHLSDAHHKHEPQWPSKHCKFQEWQPHLNAGVSPVNYRSMCVRNSTHFRITTATSVVLQQWIRLAVRYVPFLLTKDCSCPSIWTKSWPLLPLIDVQCCVDAREAALESSVLQCCHVLIFTSAFRHVVWS